MVRGFSCRYAVAMTITLEIARARLTNYLDAEAVVLRGQSYKIADRNVTRADLAEIRRGIEFWQAKVDSLATAAGTGRARTFIGAPRW